MNSGSKIFSDVKIKGTVEFTGDLFLDCDLEGEIISDGILTIGQKANIKGNVKASEITLLGEVNGNITATKSCQLQASGTLVGDIKAGKMEIHEGAVFHGGIQVPIDSKAQKPKPLTAEKVIS